MPSSSPNGFDIRAEIVGGETIIYWGIWHSPIYQNNSDEAFVVELFGLLRDMLSPDMRIRELVAGQHSYRGFLESFDGTNWKRELEMGMIFWNYFGVRSERFFTNNVLAGRIAAEG